MKEKCDSATCYCNRECSENFDKDDDWDFEFTDKERKLVMWAIMASLFLVSLLMCFAP